MDPNISPPKEQYESGAKVLLVEFERYRAEAKTNNYIEAVRIFHETPASIDEVLYHSDGMVHEGTRCNIFASINNRLLTPRTKILEGVTRNLLLDILKLPIAVVAEDFAVVDFGKASEIFITATGRGVMPVTRVDGNLVGNGEVGPVTTEVMKQYKSFVNSNFW